MSVGFIAKINHRYKIFALLLIFSLLAVVCLEFWKCQPQSAWQADSEALVWGRMADAQKSGIMTKGGLLRSYTLDESMDIHDIWKLYAQNDLPEQADSIYSRQSGLQGTVDACLAVIMQALGIGNESIQNMIWRLNSTALVFTVLLLCWWIFEEFGWAATLGSASCLLLSTWLKNTMANAYWVTWTMFLPLVITAFMGRSRAVYGHIKKRWYVVLFVCMLIRFLCGYEFTSTVMLATEVPVLYYFLKADDRNKKMQWVRMAFFIGIVELAAFAVSLGITVIQIMAWEQQGFMAAVSCIVDAVKYRTGAMVTQSDMQQYGEAISNSLQISRLSVVKNYLTSSEVLWNTWSMRELCFFWLTSAVCCKLSGHISRRELLGQGLVLGLSILTALSWYFMASGHAHIHTTVDYLLWMIPFVPLCVGFMFKNVVDTVQVMVNERRQA